MSKPITYLLTALFTTALVMSSPFLLDWMARSRKADWSTIGNIGQAYGAASAVLSAFALLGIAGSMVLQAREHAANRAQVVRNQPFSLLRQIQDNPNLYGPITGHDVAKEGADKLRQLLHAAMWVNWAKTAYLLKEISETGLRDEMFPGLFSNEIGREWWRNRRDTFRSHYPRGKAKKFLNIADEEFERVISSDAPPLPFPDKSAGRRHNFVIASALTAGTLGCLVGYQLRRRSN